MTTRLVKFVLVILVQLNFFFSVCGVNYYYTQQISALQTMSSNWTSQKNPRLEDYLPGWGSEDGGWSTPCFAEPTTNLKNWQGVECLRVPYNNNDNYSDSENYLIRIVGLTLREASISGNLPEAIGDLAPFLFLTLTGNPDLKGPIPESLGSLNDSLITLDLHDNGFNGPIPAAISSLNNLQTLDLSNNSLTGGMPNYLNSPVLQSLDLSGNDLDGNIAAGTFDYLTSLTKMDLSTNKFSGPLPRLNSALDGSSGLPKGLSMIKNINLSRNAFNESLWGLLDKIYKEDSTTNSILQVLDLSHNHIWGDASELNYLVKAIGSQIQEVHLDYNNIGGTLDLDNLAFLSRDSNYSRFRILNLANNKILQVNFSCYYASYTNLYGTIRLDGNPFCNAIDNNNYVAKCFCQQVCEVIDGKKLKNYALIIALAISVPSLVLVVLVATLLYHRSTKQHKYNLLQMQRRFEEYDVKPTIFTYRELETATRNFHPSMKLGEGGYGAVYKGELSKSSIVGMDELSKSNLVAIKKIKQLHAKFDQGMDDFLNEVALISGMKHRNLVKLKGCCLKDKQRLLVYEYVDNHDLEWNLLEGKSKEVLSWPQRLKICLGIAHGLHYLHSLAQPKIIHRDIKAANILLDNNFEPKIADFGLALLFPEETSHITTIHVAGTMGYLAPEYAILGQLSEKADVYSFGVVCLEIVSGRRNIDNKMEPDQVVLTNWALKQHQEGRIIDILDPRLDSLSEIEFAEINQVVLTALLCLQQDEARRPLMANVVAMLQGDLHAAVDIEAADIPLGFDGFSKNFDIQQHGLETIMEDRSIRLFDGQSSTQTSLYQRQHSRLSGFD